MEEESNIGAIALCVMSLAEDLILAGEDPQVVRSALVAVAVRMKQLEEQADEDARNMILRNLK